MLGTGDAVHDSSAYARALLATLTLFTFAAYWMTPDSKDARRLFYPDFTDYYQGWLALELRAGPSGARIAYAGTNIPYYLMGAGLRNEVRYVNVDAHRDWLMHDYHRMVNSQGNVTWPDPRPGWDRLHPSYEAWLANLRAEEIQILVVARANPEEGLHNLADTQGFPIERTWADRHPEIFIPFYGVRENDPKLRIYRIHAGKKSAPLTDGDRRSH